MSQRKLFPLTMCCCHQNRAVQDLHEEVIVSLCPSVASRAPAAERVPHPSDPYDFRHETNSVFVLLIQ